jgi:hypothetical protein
MKRSMLISCLWVIFILPIATVAYATAPYDITVTINGMAPPNPSIPGCNNSETCINIEGSYNAGNIVIEKISSSAAARVEVPSTTSDTTSDTLRLVNARIKATVAAQTVTIVFTRQFKKNPSGPNTYYKITANGTFSPEAGNAFTAKGWYTYPTNGTADQMGSDLTFTVSCDQTGCTQYGDKKTGEYYAPGTDRILQADFMVTLLQNGSTFSTGTGVKMAAPEQPERGNICPECTPKAHLNAFCMTTYSTAKAFGCPSCVTEDGQVAGHAKVKLFASTNWDNLSQDMAQGQGEHLASLAALLNVPAEQQPAFFEWAQGKYRASTGVETPEQVIASVHETWSSH